MKTGTIKFFDKQKGYGFITDSAGRDYFLHITALGDDIKDLKEGDNVTFETVDTNRGINATNVILQNN